MDKLRSPLSIFLTVEKGVCTLFTGQREREREKERQRERVRKERELHARASRKCGHALSVPQSVSMRDYYMHAQAESAGVL